MAKMKIFGKVLGNINQLQKFILDDLKKMINTKLFSKAPQMQDTIKDIVLESIRQQDEYMSLKAGPLRNILGIESPSSVDAILQTLEDIVIVVKKPATSGSSIGANITINMVPNGFDNLISSPGASYTSEGGFQVNWLEWLLLRGNDSVVIGYRYSPQDSPFSRTGHGIMVKNESSIFTVPGGGTVDNNWITRGIDAALPQIQAYMDKMVEQSL